MKIVTVFTSTYNRINTLDRLYKSLAQQSCFDFEWIVIDDGSTDNTEDYFKKIIEEEKHFIIKYYKQENCGKHRAINKGVKLAAGEYFFIVDSDDYLTDDSIELIYKWVSTIEINSNFVGVSGLKGYNKNKIVGKTFVGEFLDCSDLDRSRFNIYGDKSEVYKTDILRQYNFPEIKGEKFITEAVVWNRMANDGYVIRYFNKINYICEYIDSGLTRNIDKIYISNFEGYTLYIRELLSYEVPLWVKVRAIMAFGYRGRLNGSSYEALSNKININKMQLLFLTFFGIVINKIRKFKFYI